MNKHAMIKFVIDLKNIDTLKDTVAHILSENETELHLVILDEINTQESLNVIEEIRKQYKDTVIELKAVNDNLQSLMNNEIENDNYEYITFIESGIKYSKGYLNKLKTLFDKKEKLVSILPVYVNPEQKQKKYIISPMSSGKYNIIESIENTQYLLKGYFIHKSLLNDLRFNSSLSIDYQFHFITHLLLKHHEYYFNDDIKIYYYLGEEDDHSTNLYQYNKDWYMTSVKEFLIPLAKEAQSLNDEERKFIEGSLTYLLFAKYNCNVNDRQKNVLNKDDAKEFFDLSGELLKYIDDRIILQEERIGNYKIERSLKFLFIKLKRKAENKELKVNYVDGQYLLLNEDKETLIGEVSSENVFIQAINYRHQSLEIDCFTSFSDFLEADDIHINVKIGNQRIDVTPTLAYPLKKCFDITYNHKYPFRVSIPLDLNKNKESFVFECKIGDTYSKMGVKFPKPAAKLNDGLKSKTYWVFNKNRMLTQKDNVFYVNKINLFTHAKKEFILNLKRLKKSNNKKRTIYNFIVRLCYFILKPFYKNKRIWVTFDKIYKAGDNGEYMYHYINENIKDVKIYYIIQKDVPDYYRLKEAGENILIHNSFKCRVMSLLSEVVLATHVDVISYCGFGGKFKKSFKDLFNPEIVCIQHGLTIQDIAQYQNRLYDNTNFYCCASKYEIKNISKPMYDYQQKDMVLVGLARYDGLKNHDQRQILITPTWRRDVVNSSIAFVKKKHNVHFKESTYYKIYNGLINDEKLIESAKKNNYKIIYLLHPAMSSQSVDYERNDYVEIVEATGDMSYEKILTESSLMVTDYSGVQFDFAYMRKPIVYYHPDALPPHYESGGIDYDTMGFGPICKNHDEIINSLCEYMDNDCKTKEEYITRANDFFEYDDYNNCERIYNSVEDYLNSLK